MYMHRRLTKANQQACRSGSQVRAEADQDWEFDRGQAVLSTKAAH
jgi:hypothetical protein